MDLTAIKGLGPARREKLETAGVASLDALAKSDPESLTDEVGISVKILSDLREQAQGLQTIEGLAGIDDEEALELVRAGIRSTADLEQASAETLAEQTGIDADRIRSWQGAEVGEGQAEAERAGATEKAVGTGAVGAASQAAKEASRKALERFEDARVVLQEGISEARVKLEQDVLAEARILPVKARDNVDRMLEEVRGNVVVLREKADTALVRIEDEVYEGVPLFKEKVSEAGQAVADEVEEVRVRVQEIRDKRVLPKAESFTSKIKSLFGGSSER